MHLKSNLPKCGQSSLKTCIIHISMKQNMTNTLNTTHLQVIYLGV